MKKLIIALSMALSCVAFSQEKNIEKKSPEERAEKQLKKMTLDLNLDQKQVATLSELLLNQAKKRDEKILAYQINKEDIGSISRKDRKILLAEMKQNQSEMKEKMKEILNAEQFTKWEKKQQDKREKMIEKIKERR